MVDKFLILKNKLKKTNFEKYGVSNPTQNKDIREKIIQTTLKKYGVESYSKTEEYKQSCIQTNLERYGVEHYSKTEEYKERCVQTSLKKYGVSNAMQSLEIRKKANETLCKNGTHRTSRQQIYLHELYGGKLNYPIYCYAVDICFPDEKLYCEYSGGGHELRVTLGRLSQEEFDQKEIVRNNILKRMGYKKMEIISKYDKLPSDEILLQILENSRQYFKKYENHSWIEWNIDTSTVRNAEQKDGVFFNYGELRKIKNEEVKDIA